MEHEDIIKSAAESGWIWENLTNDQKDCILYFAQLVAEKEREACAKVCDAEIEEWGWDADVVDVGMVIRERGQQ